MQTFVSYSSCVSECSNRVKDSYGYCWLGVVGVLRFVLNLASSSWSAATLDAIKIFEPTKLKKVDEHVTLYVMSRGDP